LGIYIFAGLPEGKYVLKISFLGYEQNQLTVAVGNQQAVEVITRLESGTVELAEVSIAASPGCGLFFLRQVPALLIPGNLGFQQPFQRIFFIQEDVYLQVFF
jgi:hypothetical protein